MWADKRYHSLDYELKQQYGRKLYKVPLDGGFTCPNRDGRVGFGGCIFCSDAGSGDYAAPGSLSITEQINFGRDLIHDKASKGEAAFRFSHPDAGPAPMLIAYFQAFTGTYGPAEKLRALFEEAVRHPDVAILSIATRPDCLPKETLDLLYELNLIKPVWVELGLQTIHEDTARIINRGYPLSTFNEAIRELKERHLTVITHVILGLPGESAGQMIQTSDYLGKIGIDGIKFHLLHVIRGTVLCNMYDEGTYLPLEKDQYTDILIRCIEVLPESVVIHRITGDAPKCRLAAPMWSGDKKRLLNHIHHEMKVQEAFQGKKVSG